MTIQIEAWKLKKDQKYKYVRFSNNYVAFCLAEGLHGHCHSTLADAVNSTMIERLTTHIGNFLCNATPISGGVIETHGNGTWSMVRFGSGTLSLKGLKDDPVYLAKALELAGFRRMNEDALRQIFYEEGPA